MLDAETERKWYESQLQGSGTGGQAPTTEKFPDGTLRQYNAQTGGWDVIGSAPEETQDFGFVNRMRPMPDQELQATVDTMVKTPIAETKIMDGVLWGRADGDAQWFPIQDFSNDSGQPPETKTFPDGSLRQWNPATRQWEMIAPAKASGGAAAPQRAPRWPEEVELAQLQVEEKRRALEDPYTQAMRQTQSMIDTIQSQLASGQITLEEGEELMALGRANLRAAMAGATPYQLDEQQRVAERQRQNMAQSYLNNQLQAGTSMANNLLNGALSAYGNILSSSNPPPMFDPLEMARQYVYQMGGGSEAMTGLASGILQGALSGGQSAAPQAPTGKTAVRTYPQQFPDGQYEVTQWSDGTYTKKFVNNIGAQQGGA